MERNVTFGWAMIGWECQKYLLQTVLDVVPTAVTSPPFPPHITDGLTVPGARVRFGICKQSEPVVLVPFDPYPQH